MFVACTVLYHQLGVSTNGVNPKIAGWFMKETPTKKWMMITGGTPISGNFHLLIQAGRGKEPGHPPLRHRHEGCLLGRQDGQSPGLPRRWAGRGKGAGGREQEMSGTLMVHMDCIYIYIYMSVCVCMCLYMCIHRFRFNVSPDLSIYLFGYLLIDFIIIYSFIYLLIR